MFTERNLYTPDDEVDYGREEAALGRLADLALEQAGGGTIVSQPKAPEATAYRSFGSVAVASNEFPARFGTPFTGPGFPGEGI